MLRSATGISSGFDYYDDAVGGREGVAISQLQRSGTITAALAQQWISQKKDQPFFFLGWSELRSLVDDRFHFIEAPRPELYDIRRDPREQSNIIADQRRTYAALREQMAALPKNLAAPSAVNPEDAKKLQALGYLGSKSVMASDADLPDPKDGLDDLRLIQEASELARRGERRAAIERLESAISRNPRFTDAIANLAILYDDVGEFEKAAATYKKAIEANPTNAAGPAASLGWLYLRQGRFDEAEAHAKIAAATYPSYAHLLVGRIALARGDLQTPERTRRSACPILRTGSPE